MKKFIALIVFALSLSVEAKTNFLFICVDDLRPELGCFGATHIKSHNIDKLASQGRIFTNHFVQVPTCGASRPSMLASQYPKSYEALNNSYAKSFISTQEEKAEPESFPHLLRRNGYYTVSIGKVSHAYDGYCDSKKSKPEFPYSWDERHLELGKWDNAQKAYENFDKKDSKQKNKAAPFECASNDVKFPDELNTDLAIKKLDELKTQPKPFMLAIGYFKPHLPFNSPKRYWDLYNEEEIALAEQKEFGDIPTNFGHKSGEFNTYSFEASPSLRSIMPDNLAQKTRHAYYACVSFTDEQIGRLLNALEEKGLADNTVVILWGDHGWHLGDNAIWGKHSLFKKALNSPLIIKVPNMPAQGLKTDSIVESVDIYPTICDLAEVETPSCIDGKSLNSILKDPTASTKDFAFSFWKENKNQQISLHSKTEALMVENLSNKDEIIAYFNADPQESKSIAKQSPERVNALKQEILKFLESFKITYPLAQAEKPKKESKKDKSSKDSKDSKKKDSSKESKRDGKKDK